MPPRRVPSDGAGPALPRDPFGRRDPKAPGRLDFLFDARKPAPHPEPKPAPAPPAAPAEAPRATPAEPAQGAKARLEEAAQAARAPAAPSAEPAKAPPLREPGPAPGATAGKNSSVSHVKLPDTTRTAQAAPRLQTGWRGARFDLAGAFVPAPVLTAVEVVAIVVCGVIAAVFSPRK
ncbi:MAG TPA: hypothetical protein VHF22_11440 [Planctomycetota bacterium]|nr:hypothetical protein [Planctomycetota bacterium]